jgi:hypothetical protein
MANKNNQGRLISCCFQKSDYQAVFFYNIEIIKKFDITY